MKFTSLKHNVFLSVLIILSSPLYSQSINISGKIINEKRQAVEKVQIVLRQINGGRIITFTQSSKDGSFELKRENNNINLDSLEMFFSCLGYSAKIQKIPRDNKPILVEMEVTDVKLKEVSISPKKILQRSDTITYLVSSFSSAEDRTIGDVLKKMPGIVVADNGKITYQGKDLNKFYIEGSDMLGGRYGLATNNISYKDVASVNIMENHQPVRALQDMVFSDSPALNIKLKEDAKSRWAGTIKGGVGIPELWIAEAFAMRFKAKTQSLNTYKGNNTGNESYEMNVFFPSFDLASIANTSLPTYMNASPSVASDIGSSRSTFNQTNNLTSNNLFKVGKDLDLVTEFTGSLDRRESEYSSQSTYYLGDDLVSIEDKTEFANSFKKAFTGNLHLKSNQENYYMNNDFNFNYDRNDPSIDITGTYQNNQKSEFENLKISNNFDILKRTGEKFFTFRSNNEFASKPQFLEITKNGQTPIKGKVDISSFYSNNSFSYSFRIGKFRFDSPINLLYQYKQIENELNNTINNLNTHKLRINTTPSFEYNLNDIRFNLSGLLFYQTILLDKKWHHIFGVNPRLSINWTVSSMLSMGASASYSNNLPDENLYYHGTILNNYRTQTAGYIDFSTGNTTSFSANVAYKDVLEALFTNLIITYLKRENTRISGQDFVGDYILNIYQPGKISTEMLSVSGSFSKGIDFLKSSIVISPLFAHNKSSILRNSVTIPYTSDSYIVKCMINSRLSRKCNLIYEASYNYNKNKMESNREYFSSKRLYESLKITYSFVKSLQMNCKFDHYMNELSKNNYKNSFFSDISISYLPGNRWELSCGIKNIFNERNYSYFIENELSTFYKSYKIRPRNILASATYRF